MATVVEEDPNVFKGEGDFSPQIPKGKGNNEKAGRLDLKNNIAHLGQDQIDDQKKDGEQNKSSLMNIDKFLLESQDTYKSPGVVDEVPDYIR